MPARPIDFYFDFSSPYAYIASEWIEALAARHGRTVSWRAILLAATFPITELKSNVSYPLKRDYVMVDFERSARFAGVPLTLPRPFPISTQNAARVFWWLNDSDEARARQWARHCLRAYFTRGVDLSDNQALAGLGSEFGLEDGQTEAVASNPAWKARLKGVNDAAIAAGVFGVPFFVVDGEPFWGNDRRAQLERWLDRGPF
ncbi:MAG TPA: 2-hydroxychromene-2-carboxylate isomerase [Burkholderiaceae bacterium]|nr:2-hydroxychromene-2-carboxylate isomerase [Burkholderiaceae bacterium]